MELNKVKITLANKSFDVTLDEGESLYLELKNNKGEVYLSNVPKKNDLPIHDEADVSEASRIKMSNEVINDSEHKRTNSSIYDVLNEVVKTQDINDEAEFNETESVSEDIEEVTVADMLNEITSNQDDTIEEDEAVTNDEDLSMNEDDVMLDLDESTDTDKEETNNFRERYLLELEE